MDLEKKKLQFYIVSYLLEKGMMSGKKLKKIK